MCAPGAAIAFFPSLVPVSDPFTPPPPDGPAPDDRRKVQREYLQYSGMGLEFAAILGVLAWLGYHLDRLLGLAGVFPVFLLAGLFLGMAGGIYRMKRRLDSLPKRRPPRRGGGSGGPSAP